MLENGGSLCRLQLSYLHQISSLSVSHASSQMPHGHRAQGWLYEEHIHIPLAWLKPSGQNSLSETSCLLNNLSSGDSVGVYKCHMQWGRRSNHHPLSDLQAGHAISMDTFCSCSLAMYLRLWWHFIQSVRQFRYHWGHKRNQSPVMPPILLPHIALIEHQQYAVPTMWSTVVELHPLVLWVAIWIPL